MRKFLIITIAVMVLATGCSKKVGTGAGTSPSPSATAAAGTATNTPSGAATTAPENLPSITKEQVDKLDPKSTYEDFVKIVGKDVKPIKEESGKKTYELKVSNEANTFMDITYFNDGKMSEKKVFKR